MLKELQNEEIKLEDMTNLEFTQLMSEWKQQMFKDGMRKNLNELEIVVLEKGLETVTSEKNTRINTLINNHLKVLKRIEK